MGESNAKSTLDSPTEGGKRLAINRQREILPGPSD
jgi:hypothetical protein